VTAIIAGLEGNIARAEVATYAGRKARISLEVRIEDAGHLEEISKRIAALKEVLSVERV